MIAVSKQPDALNRSLSRRRSLQLERSASIKEDKFDERLDGPGKQKQMSPPLSGKELNPLQNGSASSRPRSVNELRRSSLFMDSEGSTEKRLSLLFVEPSSFRSYRRPKSIGGLPASQSQISLTLMGNDEMLEMYRENAKKGNDPKTQLDFAKYLLASAKNLSDANSEAYDPNASKKLEKEGIHCIKRLQKMNYPEAIFIVASWHENEMFGYDKNESKTTSLYLSAAKLGYPPAMDKIGYHYEKKKDYTRAVAYYKKAAALADPSSNYRLGVAYIYGELKLGVNHKNAQFYLRRAAIEANQSCPTGAYIWALILLGLYEEDLGIRDTVEGMEYLIKAANLGYRSAQNKVGFNYEFGEHGFPVDPSLSIDYYSYGAKAGHPEAQLSLSGWYFTGAPGILDQDDKLAFEWCKKATEQHLPKAEYAMGHYYEVGVGVEPNLNMAMEWYQKAAKHGSKEATERLKQPDLAPTLSRAQIGTIRDKKNKNKNKDKGGCVIS